MVGWIGGWKTDEWMGECSGWIGRWVRQRRIEHAWVNGWLHRWENGWMGQWIDGRVE